MKTILSIAAGLLLMLASVASHAQEIQTVFRGARSSGGYGAISNKFSNINGDYANLAEIYGGWFINQKLLLGIGAAATTNNIRVPKEYSALPEADLSYEYGQFGLMTEYVFGSNKALHFNFTMLTGAGFTVQYMRHNSDEWDDWSDWDEHQRDENWFFVVEPGVQVEVNLLRWMRFSPGVSYRKTFGSDARGLKDGDLSDISYNVTLKFGKF